MYRARSPTTGVLREYVQPVRRRRSSPYFTRRDRRLAPARVSWSDSSMLFPHRSGVGPRRGATVAPALVPDVNRLERTTPARHHGHSLARPHHPRRRYSVRRQHRTRLPGGHRRLRSVARPCRWPGSAELSNPVPPIASDTCLCCGARVLSRWRAVQYLAARRFEVVEALLDAIDHDVQAAPYIDIDPGPWDVDVLAVSGDGMDVGMDPIPALSGLAGARGRRTYRRATVAPSVIGVSGASIFTNSRSDFSTWNSVLM